MAVLADLTPNGVEEVQDFFKEKTNYRPQFIRMIGVAGRIELEWTNDGGDDIRTTNRMATSNEMLFKIPSVTSLGNLRIVMLDSDNEEIPFCTLTVDGNGTSVSYDDALIVGRIQFNFETTPA